MEELKILLVDDHPLILQGTEGFLNSLGYSNVLTSTNGMDAYNIILKESPDVLILDYSMPKLNGLELAKLCKKEKLNSKIILLTLQKNELILKEIDKTIDGYLLKEDTLDQLKECIDSVINNKNYVSNNIYESSLSYVTSSDLLDSLTASEIKILKNIAQNKSSQSIADDLFISIRTVEKHRSNIIHKLGLSKKGKPLKQFVMANKDHFKF